MLERSDPERRRLLGDAIKDARAARHCSSQAQFSIIAGISERSVAGAEAGEHVGRKVLAAIEAALHWPNRKTSEYLDGDDDALQDLVVQGPPITSGRFEATVDVVPAPENADWVRELRVLRSRLTKDQFFQLVDQLSRPEGE